MARSHEPLKGGYDVDDNAIRFSNYFHVLRELVHLSCGWLPVEPRPEGKDARPDPPPGAPPPAAAPPRPKPRGRLYELRAPRDSPGAPAAELAALLARAAAAETP